MSMADTWRANVGHCPKGLSGMNLSFVLRLTAFTASVLIGDTSIGRREIRGKGAGLQG